MRGPADEIRSPTRVRGRFTGALAGFFSFGFVAAALLGYFVIPLAPEAWRYVILLTAEFRQKRRDDRGFCTRSRARDDPPDEERRPVAGNAEVQVARLENIADDDVREAYRLQSQTNHDNFLFRSPR